MTRIIWIFHFLIVVFLTIESKGDEIWKESFPIPGKGFWGNSDGTSINSDMKDIVKWSLDVSACQLTAETDYVKTTSTSGGRFEAMDCDGEAIWTSEIISITDFKNISLKVNVSETGSGSNSSSKYIRVSYLLDNGTETLFETNGESTGNFGSGIAMQAGLNGESLRIVIRMNSSYASDKLIVDEIVVEGESKVVYSSNHISEINIVTESNLEIVFAEEINASLVTRQNIQIIDVAGLALQLLDVISNEPFANKLNVFTSPAQGTKMKLIVSGIYDKSGLLLPTDTIEFEWMVACTAQAVVINEIMADPIPAISLPEYEYIELYNRTETAFRLKQLLLQIDGKSLQLPDSIIVANGFSVLCSAESAEYFENAVVVKQFPALRNSSAEIVIANNDIVIDLISYSSEWYGNEEYADGGRSLERIDPNRFCGQDNNWTASKNVLGGTPGADNSVCRKNIDQLPAKITYIDVVSANQLDVYFSEKIDPKCICNTSNYVIGEGAILLDTLTVVNASQVSLFFSDKFSSKVNYQLEMKELIDVCGNQAINKSGTFMYFEPEEYDLIITELFVDPYPSVGLTEYEYIEIFNRADYPVQTNNLLLTVEGKSYELGRNTIRPHEYIVLTSLEGASLMPQSLSVKSFPSLRNSSGTVQLIFDKTRIIDQLEYFDSWYANSEKRDGGWSLERIDNNRFCGPAGNWTSSVSQSGGTPGVQNSVASDNQDISKPEVVEMEVISSSEIKLLFSENINRQNLETKNNYTANYNLGHPIKLESIGLNEINLTFAEKFVPNKEYSLQIVGLADDCGNIIDEMPLNFSLMELSPGDVLISEVLFNPYPGGTDFVEIINHSDKTINLKNLSLASRDDKTELKEISRLSEKNRWIEPGDFVLCTKDSLSVALVYYTTCPECFCETSRFPSYSDDAGDVVLLDDSLTVLDEFAYSEKMHHPLIEDCEGVSLERLSYETPASVASNWHSAASTVGFATPGYANSQHRDELVPKENIVLAPEVFSPNNDGFNDRLLIHYQLEEPGYSANVKVYDSMGRLVNHLVKNELLAQEGEWHWDGEKADNTRPGLGIYIVLVELFDMQGNVKKYKKTCTLTDRL